MSNASKYTEGERVVLRGCPAAVWAIEAVHMRPRPHDPQFYLIRHVEGDRPAGWAESGTVRHDELLRREVDPEFPVDIYHGSPRPDSGARVTTVPDANGIHDMIVGHLAAIACPTEFRDRAGRLFVIRTAITFEPVDE